MLCFLHLSSPSLCSSSKFRLMISNGGEGGGGGGIFRLDVFFLCSVCYVHYESFPADVIQAARSLPCLEKSTHHNTENGISSLLSVAFV